MKEKIIELLETYKSEVDNWNDAIFESDFNNLADELVKLCTIPHVSQQRELLIAYERFLKNNVELRVDAFLAINSENGKLPIPCVNGLVCANCGHNHSDKYNFLKKCVICGSELQIDS